MPSSKFLLYVNHSFPGTYNLKVSVQPAGK